MWRRCYSSIGCLWYTLWSQTLCEQKVVSGTWLQFAWPANPVRVRYWVLAAASMLQHNVLPWHTRLGATSSFPLFAWARNAWTHCRIASQQRRSWLPLPISWNSLLSLILFVLITIFCVAFNVLSYEGLIAAWWFLVSYYKLAQCYVVNFS